MLAALSACCLKISLLGGFEVHFNTRPVSGIQYNKMRALLAYLVVERERDHNRDSLACLLWSSNDPVTARGNLRRTLADLRRVLEQPTGMTLFSTSKHTIRFVGNAQVDATSFCLPMSGKGDDGRSDPAVLEKQLSLYRGEFLAGLVIPDSPDFSEWQQYVRELLHRRVLALLEQLANHYEQIGAYDKALTFALRHAEIEPWREPVGRCVMRLYALCGRSNAALSHYETLCRLLKSELASTPENQTTSLAERIRAGDLQPEVPAMQALLPPRPRASAERRQVSVLYCELTSPDVEDPDEVLALLSQPQARCLEIIRSFAGYVQQTHGGGLLAYFGYPQAHEHSARFAVQTALALVREAKAGIEIRASVHTGLIVTGNDSEMPDIAGKTSKLALQLRHASGHAEVSISPQTHEIVAAFFSCLSLGVKKLPGSAQAMEIFMVAGERSMGCRIDAAPQLTPLAGRETQLAQLTRMWTQVLQGARQVVLVQGEAGIGKSRLLHSMKEHLHGQPHAIRELRCFPELSQSPFHPLISMLEGILELLASDTPEIRFRKLAAYLEKHFPDSAQAAIPLLGQLLSLPIAESCVVPVLSARKQKELTNRILLEMLQTLSIQQPVLLIAEDLHWCDPSTLELLTRFVRESGESMVLALLTARPEFTPPWPEDSITYLPLGALSDPDVAHMVSSINDTLPATLVQQIIGRADGVPLFVEEIAKLAAEAELSRIPSSLHDLLATRIDALGEAKLAAQLAATLGREFDINLLYKIFPGDKEILATQLATLIQADLIRTVQKNIQQFKHALIQEAAYQSQSRSDRQQAHLRIARVLESEFPEVASHQPELLAQHLAAAGLISQAMDYWLRAGQRAALNSAHQEAIGHFNGALELLRTLPAGLERDRTEFNILVSLCPVLYGAKGYGSEAAGQANARISSLSSVVGDSPELFPAKWALIINTIAQVGSRGMPEAAQELLGMSQDDSLKLLSAHFLMSNASFWLGNFEAARTHGEQVLSLYQPDQAQLLQEQYGTDLSIFSGAYLFSALCFMGYQDQADQLCAALLAQARAQGHPHTLGQALSWAAVLQRFQRRPEAALPLAAEAIELSRQHDFSLWLACGEMTHGWALAMHGDLENGMRDIRASITGMRAALGGISVVFLSTAVEALAQLGHHAEALEFLGEALADAAQTGDGHFLVELYRLKGVCLLGISRSNEVTAEVCFTQALSLSRQQQARLFELRAGVALARLWQDQQKADAALEMLMPIYQSFTEGHDSPDLREAASLLSLLQQISSSRTILER